MNFAKQFVNFFQGVKTGVDALESFNTAFGQSTFDEDDIVLKQLKSYVTKFPDLNLDALYADSAAFEAFVHSGGNIGLYKNVSSMLSGFYEQTISPPYSLLDIGVGTGMALIPALAQTTSTPSSITLIEPSRSMLDAALPCIPDKYAVKSHNVEIQSFMKNCDSESKWDICQATFSLHNLEYEPLLDVLKWIRKHCTRLIIAEFDVDPVFENPENGDPLDLKRVEWILERYHLGIREYTLPNDTQKESEDTGQLVIHGFLIPVLLAYFEAKKTTQHEMPASKWIELLEAAGFDNIDTSHCYPYWWSDAVIFDASCKT